MASQYQAPSVKKAFQILRIISKSDRGMGVSDLARHLGMSKGTVHGITAALEELGAIFRDPTTKRYTSGLTLLELGKSAYSQFDLKDLARPIMENLMDRFQESVFLGVLNGDRVTILDIAESRNDLKITSPVGTTIPLTAAATGKVFLASLPEPEALKIINSKGLTKYTENTISDHNQFLREIEKVRTLGYATDYEEYILGVRAVASPITGNKYYQSAIWVVGFKTSLNDEKMNSLIKETKKAAELITRKFEDRPII
jgi:DNA-binding IclR family transcriptional regulator